MCWSRKFRAFAVNGVPMRGAHPTLRSCFYPNYSFAAAAQGPASADSEWRAEQLAAQERPAPGGPRVRGVKGGLLVDAEMRRTVALLLKHRAAGLAPLAFTSHAQQLLFSERLALPARDKALLRKRLSGACAKIWQALVRLGLTPCATQVPVGCPALRSATAADLVCEDALRRKVVVEVKTGFLGYHLRHSGALAGIWPRQTDCPANQHQLQAFLTTELYRRTFPTHAVAQGAVLRVDALGVELTPVQPWVLQGAAAILARVRDSGAAPRPAAEQRSAPPARRRPAAAAKRRAARA